MSKDFAPRVSKKERKSISFDTNLYRFSDSKLLEGARLAEIKLKDIQVKEQVRTKFNDDSIRELAANIKANGLIQPLVIHLQGGTYRLICGERRFRAMSLIQQESAPCFILENKTTEELMAIQFSENSSREELHYVDKAEGIFNYHAATQASERKIVEALGISKSEVHRGLLIARLPQAVRDAAKKYDVEKYVLLELGTMSAGSLKSKIETKLVNGEITKRNDLRKILKAEEKNNSKSESIDPEVIKAIQKPSLQNQEGLRH